MSDWNAERYHNLSWPQQAWGRRVLERLPLQGSEHVLDLGCGSGRLTEEIHRRLPHGRVVGADRSGRMLDAAAMWLGEHAPGAPIVQADAAALPFRRAFDLAAAADSPPLTLDYWRLNISARRPA